MSIKSLQQAGKMEKFLPKKFQIFAMFSYLSPHFYTHNVKILLKRTDRLGNPSTTQNFVRIAQGVCRHCIAPWR